MEILNATLWETSRGQHATQGKHKVSHSCPQNFVEPNEANLIPKPYAPSSMPKMATWVPGLPSGEGGAREGPPGPEALIY